MNDAQRQHTLARSVTLCGIGFFSNADVTIRLHPAPADSGILFRRIDLPGTPAVPARIEHVVPAERRTAIAANGARVELIEHLMAALAALQIDNCRIDIDGPEVPGFDGSSRPFVEAIERAGTTPQQRPANYLRPRATIGVRRGDAEIRIDPADSATANHLHITYHLDYGPAAPIAACSAVEQVGPECFRRRIAAARTFVLQREVAHLRAAGYGRRVSEEDLLVIADDGQPAGNAFRFSDECARHKLLDVIGDLALTGCRLAGRVTARRSGHALNHELARRLLAEAGSDPTSKPHAA